MKRVLLLTVLTLALMAGQSTAQVQMLYVGWNPPSTQQINFKFDGINRSALAGPAQGRLDPLNASPANPNAEVLGLIYCVDVFNLADPNTQYMVNVRYDATGWLDPVGDGDDLRDPNGLYYAAWMVNRFAPQADTLPKRIGLNVALWQVVYGNKFELLPTGTDPGQSNLTTLQRGYYDQYMAAWNGQQSMSVRWFDNDAEGNVYQDFIQAVPEPTSLLLLGGGLLGLAFLRRRRQS